MPARPNRKPKTAKSGGRTTAGKAIGGKKTDGKKTDGKKTTGETTGGRSSGARGAVKKKTSGRDGQRPGKKPAGPPRKRKPTSRKGHHRPRVVEEAADPRGERLQKVLAAAGLGSRRKCEELILAARVDVDREIVIELGTRVDMTRQEVRVDGVALPKTRLAYYAVNKPDGVICSSSDPSGRPRVIDLMPTKDVRLFTVGRLDLHSEGLILLTNDGELANKLTHPRYGIQKVYRVLVAGQPTSELLAQLRRGIHLAEAYVCVPSITIKSRNKQSTVLEMVLEEGRNREIRRVLARIGHKVLRLVRMSVGPVKLGELGPGEARRLHREEVRELQEAVRQQSRVSKKRDRRAAENEQ